MIYLRSIKPKRTLPPEENYPFTLPVIRNLETLDLTAPVTFFVGENGTGKSTLLEAIGAASGVTTIGGQDLAFDPTMDAVRELASHLTLSWSKRTHRGFFMRSEDFFNFANRVDETEQEMRDLAGSYSGDSLSYGERLARGSALGQQAALRHNYGDGLHARSHGEAFLQVFQSRFVPGGLYLLDEPDTALSPLRQLALLSMMTAMVHQDAQFIIATHSPILMAFPDAEIFKFDDGGIQRVAYDEVDNVVLMRDFLTNPEAFLRQL